MLADHGIKTIVLVADHGHLFADEIGEDMKIEAPGGKVEDLHRRVWVGVGGNSEPSYLRTSLASLGVDSEFDIATPWTFAVFKSKGGGASVFPRRTVSARTDRSRGRDALGGEVLGPLDRHSMDADSRHGETDHEVLFRADCREPERVEPVRI